MINHRVLLNWTSKFDPVRSALFILILLLSAPLMAHEYYFGFAEVEYNDFSQQFEITLTLSAHDTEKVFKEQNIFNKALEQLSDDPKGQYNIVKYLSEHFQLISNSEPLSMELDGSEVMKNGVVNFYLHSSPTEFKENLECRFDLFMDVFPDQENKITLLHKGKSSTIAFPANDHSKHLIKPENE